MIDKAANAAAAVHGLPPLPAKKMGVGSARAQRARAELKALQGGAANKSGGAKKAAPMVRGEARALWLMKQRVTLGIKTLDKAQEHARRGDGGRRDAAQSGGRGGGEGASVGAVSDDALESGRGARLDAALRRYRSRWMLRAPTPTCLARRCARSPPPPSSLAGTR